MDKATKQKVVEQLRKAFENVKGMVLTDFRGLNVEKMTDLRAACRKDGLRYLVVKNTLMHQAVGGTDKAGIQPYLKGSTGILYAFEDPVQPFRVAGGFEKKFDPLKIKAGWLDGQAGDPSVIKAWASLPGRNELRAKLLSVLVAAPKRFLGLLQAAPRDFLGVLNARKESLATSEHELGANEYQGSC